MIKLPPHLTTDILPAIPRAILDPIVARAQRSHPHDYQTQAYVIRTQVESYLTIQNLITEPEYAI